MTEKLKIVDLGVGMPAALAAQMFGNFGAEIHRVEPAGGDPFHQIHAAYGYWRRRSGAKPAQTVELEGLLAKADLCILGGESHPGLEAGPDAAELSRRHPRLVVLEIVGYATAEAADRPAVDLLVQARTGLVNEEYTTRPMAYSLPMPSYGAALLGVLGAQAALLERRRTGKGQVVRTSLQQGTALWLSGNWSAAERPDKAFHARMPKDVKQPVFRCGDGKYVMVMFGTPGSLAGIYKATGVDIAVDPNDRNLPDPSRGPLHYFCDRSILEPAFARQKRDEVLEKLWASGVAADAVLPPGAAWDDPQAQENGMVAFDDAGWRGTANPIRVRMVEAEGAEPAPAAIPPGSGPLNGRRFVDFGSWVAGPYGAKLLGDLGADVIKIETMGGDPFRFMYRNFASVTRGKRSIVIDLKKPEGIALAQRICATADAVTHNMRVGVAERIGIDGKSLRKFNPDLVALHSSAYGAAGPKALNSGWDPVLQPYCGHSLRAGGEGNDPLVYAIAVLDYGAGTLGAIGMLQGLLEADGKAGADIETNLLNIGLYLLSELVQWPDGSFQGAPMLDRGQTGFHPAERLYQAKDGWIAVAARTEDMAAALARHLDLDLGPRTIWGAKQAEQIAARIATRPSRDLIAEFDRAGIWAERCTEDAWEALTANEDARTSGFVVERDDPKYGRVNGVGRMMEFSGSELRRDLAAIPKVGGDTRQILGELGLSAEEIDGLYEKGVVA